MFFRVNDAYSLLRSRVARAFACLMLSQSAFDVGRNPGVERSVGTFENVYKIHFYFLAVLLSTNFCERLNSLSSRCMQPAQQQGRRIPPFILEIPFLIRISRVSAFLPEITQQIHSLRASGLISCQRAFTAGVAAMAARRSGGSLWTTPPPNVSVCCRGAHIMAMHLFYQMRGIDQGHIRCIIESFTMSQ